MNQTPIPQMQLPQMVLPPAHINFLAEIVTKTVEVAMGAISDLVNRGHPEICFALSSPGGSVSDGIALYNFLRAIPVNVVTHNIGSVNSIANIVFLAGQTRYACSHTTFMFHGVSMQTQSPQVFERKALKENLASIISDEKRIGGIVAERTELSRESIDTFFLEAKTLTAEEALEAKIVNEVRQFCIPKGRPIFSLGFQR